MLAMRGVFSALVGCLIVLSGCKSVVTVGDQQINCDDYVSRYAGINIDLSKIKERQFSIGLTFDQLSKFEKLQGDYILQARNLCQSAPLYFKDPPEGPREWRCRDERLSRSLEQLRVITSAFEALKTEKEAAANAEAIRKTVEHYFNAFMSGQSCTSPPSVRQLAQIKQGLDLINLRLSAVIKQEIVSYKEALPTDTTSLLVSVIKGLANAAGFRAKTDLLLTEFYYDESSRALLNPASALALLGSADLDQRLVHYAARKDEDTQKLRVLSTSILRQLRVTSFVSQEHSSFRKALNDAVVVSGSAQKRRLVAGAIDAIEQDPTLNKTASVHNLLGTLAVAVGDRERALKSYCEGYLLDKEHLPIYDSLSYALWRLNGDSYTARQYAQEGLSLVTELQIRVKDAQQKTFENLANLRGKAAADRARLQRYSDEIIQFYRERSASIEGHLAGIRDRLATNAAYYSAIEMSNKEDAERMAQEVINRTPENEKDSDYLDLLGFVKLRFATDAAGIEEAIGLFRKAQETAQTQEQKQLAERHIALAGRTKDLRRALVSDLNLE